MRNTSGYNSGVNKVLNIMVRKYIVPMEVSIATVCIEFLTQPDIGGAIGMRTLEFSAGRYSSGRLQHSC